MKRIIFTLFICVSAATAALCQPRFTSNTETFNVGQVEWKNPAHISYTITNTGNQPLVLTEVEPDCACSVADWTQDPIAPGEKGTINLVFDAEMLGHFHKSVAIYTNAEPHLVYLYFNGEVVTAVKNYEQTHPYLIGQIRIDRNVIDFPDIHPGDKPSIHLSVANLSDRAYEPVLMHLPRYIEMTASSTVLQKGERGTLTLTLHPEKLVNVGLTQTSVYLSRFAGDKVSDENKIPLSVILLPDFSNLTETERQNAPRIELSQTRINLSQKLAQKEKASQTVEIVNKGLSSLHIARLQVSHPAIRIHLKKNVLRPGETVKLKVTVQKSDIDEQQKDLNLLLITNDPAHPKVMIHVEVDEVEEATKTESVEEEIQSVEEEAVETEAVKKEAESVEESKEAEEVQAVEAVEEMKESEEPKESKGLKKGLKKLWNH